MNRQHYDSVQAALVVFRDDPLLFEPGTGYEYSTYGYTLLSAVLEVAGEDDFLALMRERVFDPLGMDDTGPELAGERREDRATYYQPGSDGTVVATPTVDNSNKWAGGGFESTPTDLVTLGAALLAGDVVSPGTRELLFTPQTFQSGEPTGQPYALGWRSERAALPDTGREVRVVHHGGTALGGRSFFVLLPDEGVAVSLLANYDSRADPFGDFVDATLVFVDLFTADEPVEMR